jgi:aldehyde dehydrogenase (NAD+)
MNVFQDLFERRKHHFATSVTRSYAWRTEQLDRMARLLGENDAALQRAVGQADAADECAALIIDW